MNLSNITILNIKGADYRCTISDITKSEAINAKNKFGQKKREHYKI